MHRETKKAPGVPGLSRKHPNLGIKVPQTLRYYPTAQIRQGADRISAPTRPILRRKAGRDLSSAPLRRQAQMTNRLTPHLPRGSVPADTQRQKKAPGVPGLPR